RAPAPAAPEPAAAPRLDPSASTVTQVRLDAAFFADAERVRALVAHWSRDELYTLGNALVGEGDRRIKGELLEVLRALFVEGEESPAARVEFVTDPNYDEGVFWSEDTVYLHDADGTVTPFSDFSEEGEEGADPEYAALDERFRDLLADYSRADWPSHGDHLVVDLTTGEFERSGKWSLT
ncbi:hypothetical protein, partial [Streptomyces solincola]|uniref:hypothetical protein n=1 Tax=Streptomyces solincola TaxID=2100817 RepID=UPI001C6140D0